MTADPALSSRLIDQENRYGPGGQPNCEVVLTRADGGYVWDVQGNRYLDFMAGRAGLAQGHCHTRIAAAMVEQCLRLGLAGRPYRHDRLPPLLEKLCTLTGFEQAVCLEAGDTAAAALRAKGLSVDVFPGGGKLKAQFKYADQKKAAYAIVIGPDEAGRGVMQVKSLKTGEEQALTLEEACARIAARV